MGTAGRHWADAEEVVCHRSFRCRRDAVRPKFASAKSNLSSFHYSGIILTPGEHALGVMRPGARTAPPKAVATGAGLYLARRARGE
jgi:hypothetical protein